MVQELESTPSWVTLGNHFASHVPHWLKSCDCFPKCRKKCPKAAVVGFQAGFGRASSPGTHISMGLRAWFFASHPCEEDKETSAGSAWLLKAM